MTKKGVRKETVVGRSFLFIRNRGSIISYWTGWTKCLGEGSWPLIFAWRDDWAFRGVTFPNVFLGEAGSAAEKGQRNWREEGTVGDEEWREMEG